ncbi:MAG TPA: hypothetical protein PLD20_11945 [Blastocatellia bacterium]|nr:hypothetical protein [Blastocatellia bacterium]HMV86199.1 hypothetical protein [Blastocatellia bacterium]HMX27760.1 hypothetical protein [Blastocatellia bacterium]HMY70980.1 hypothetical protein [Blastocatellia bacterium]HMZ18637.1 hypothetical protein [Blastocatellia bacterium]
MATAQDAELIIKLYDLRRDETMRKARNFVMLEFFPTSIDDFKALYSNPDLLQQNAYYRQATSYWDMVAAMVNHGSIDRALFYDTNGEFFAIWAKIGEFISELRGFLGPQYMGNLEKLVNEHPNGAQRVELMKARFKVLADRRAVK